MLPSDWLKTFLGNISKLITFLNICGLGFQYENKNHKNFHLKSSLSNLNKKTFQENWKLNFYYAFLNTYGPSFLHISGHIQKVKKASTYIYICIYIYIYIRWKTERDQADKKQTFYRTTALPAGPINQVDNDCFWRDCFDPKLSTTDSSPNFWRNLLMFWYSSINFFEFSSSSSKPKITYVYAILCCSIVICYLLFYLLFAWFLTNFATLARAQLCCPDVNHYVFIIVLSKGP